MSNLSPVGHLCGFIHSDAMDRYLKKKQTLSSVFYIFMSFNYLISRMFI